MSEQPYETEDVLQALLAAHPDLLAGDQANGEPRRWLLLAREAPLRDSEGGTRWSVDHLFVDQDAVPTIVEVKRSSDTRIRREVIGQMLEYAANAVVHWRLDELRASFEAQAREKDRDPAELLLELLGADEPERFWEQVRTNLAASKLRLVFVADDIPSELRRLVEFLNEQMQSAEVLAVEVKQYVDEDGRHQTLVPRLVGQTERARQAKGKDPSRQWDADSLFHDLEERHGSKAVDLAKRLMEWSAKQGMSDWFGSGQKDGSYSPVLREGPGCWPFILYTYGRIEIQFQNLSRRPPFERADLRKELQVRLNAIPGISIPDARLELRPSFPIAAVFGDPALRAFLDAMDWVLTEFRNALAAR
jgi:hypothetical protein